jgi:predicted ATPase/DNA-binding CsgD family transcriptional regulator
MLRTGVAALPNNLPASLTRFIGREHELVEAARLLAQTRLLTLTGPGGTGKTRFGLELAAGQLEHFPDGVFFVGLAPLNDASLVISTVAQILGIHETGGRSVEETLRDYLHQRQLLLLLDNFEQILGAAPLLIELLMDCSQLKLLVTSRVALRVSGEQELPVSPLTVPQLGDEVSLEQLSQYAAVRLFVERAQAVRPSFSLTVDNAGAVTEICRRLDGLPLALELAAARIRLLSPETMLTRLSGRLQLLTGGGRDLPVRQRTLRDTIAWSYDLLGDAEQTLFRRLAIFVGGCTLEAATAIAGQAAGPHSTSAAETPAHDVLETVESLVAKSLVGRVETADGQARLVMLETIREYGLERLTELGTLEAVRRWQTEYFLALAEQAVPCLRGPEQRSWLDRLEAEHDNFRAALEWSLRTGQAKLALRLSSALAWFWQTRSYISEGRRWLEAALAANQERTPARLRALYGAAWLAHYQREASAARLMLEESRSIAVELGDRWSIAWGAYLLGRVAYFDGDALGARVYADECQQIGADLGDDWLVASGLHLRGLAAHIESDFAAARDLYEQSLIIRRQLGYQEGIGILLQLSGMAVQRQGDFASASMYYAGSIQTLRELGARWLVCNSVATFSSLASVEGRWERAVRLAGASAMLSETISALPIPLVQDMLEEGIQAARATLSQSAFAEAWTAGRALSLEDALDEALATLGPLPSESAASPADLTPRQGLANLSPRELEVLRLVASGSRNREICEALVLSESTVETHLRHIYEKTGARNRADAVAYALRQGLV